MIQPVKQIGRCQRRAGVDSGDENVMYLAATDSYVNLGFFNGASLSDPNGRIAGTGKRMRHVKVRALEDVDQAQFESWIREAVDWTTQPSFSMTSTTRPSM